MRTLLLLLSVVLISCQAKKTFRDFKYEDIEMAPPIKDVRLPTKLWEILESSTTTLPHETNQKGDEAANSQSSQVSARSGSTEFLPVKVYLHERNKGILGGKNFLLTFQAPGGELDLKDFVTTKNGSFFFAIEPKTDLPLDDMRVYFLSDSIERQLNDDSYGTGCNTYYDITSAFKKALSRDGFLVNTTSQRHVSALAGTYFFVLEQGKKLLLTRLTIGDSRYPQFHCKR